MHVVTGGCGFIGSNIVAGLNTAGISNILVVDNLQQGQKFLNINDLQIADFMDKREFRKALQEDKLPRLEAIYHQGACSDTMEYNGLYMMDNNFTYSKELLHYCLTEKIPFLYASSASVYGSGTIFSEKPEHEAPLNVYGYSKLLFDQYVRRLIPTINSTVVGFRYFNVYGPREIHKGKMASMVYQLYLQLKANQTACLFKGTAGYGDGEQRRDFISVKDIVNINFEFANGPIKQGIVNAGTGNSRSFNDIANILIKILSQGQIEYKPMPDVLLGKYQSFTEADITKLGELGYHKPMSSLEEGIADYVAYLTKW